MGKARSAVGRIAPAFLAVLLAGCGAPPPPPPAPPPRVVALPPPPPPPPPPHELLAAPVALKLVDSEIAQVFHVVDELARWYPGAHPQYAAWAAKEMPLDDAECALLAKHARLRAKRRWGSLDQAFEVNAPLADALQAAREKRLLSASDAEDERVLLEHFQARLQPFLRAQREGIVAFEAQLAAELPKVAPLLARLGRFCEVSDTLPVRAVLVPTPAAFEGEGRVTRSAIVIDVRGGDDPLVTFFHPLAHAILLQRRGTIAMGAGKCDEAVDDETLEDGLAYAFAPGLVHPGEHDLLRERAEASHARPLREPRVRAERLGLAVRTELSVALEGGHETVSSFLPRVCDAWANVTKP